MYWESTRMKSKRFKKNDWILLGLNALAVDGADAITIDNLCERAAKTKGSFYFHFSTIEEYLIDLTNEWVDAYTTKITHITNANSERMDFLNQLAARIDLELEAGIRQLAARNEHVQESVRQADETRINWLADLYNITGKYSKSDAFALANIEIAAFTGFKMIKPDMKPKEARDFYTSFLKLTSRA
jgi:AcrR family transcriptional regulator